MCPRDVITVITWVSLVKPVETKLVERKSGKGIHVERFSHFLSFIVNVIKNKYIYVIVFFNL